MFKKIDHIEIVPSNIDRTIEFYTKVLGFSVKSRRKMEGVPDNPIDEIAYVELNGSVIELLSMKNPAPLPKEPKIGYRMMAIEVEDMNKAIAYLKSKGVEISQESRNLGKSKRAEIKDPDGLSIELRQW